MTSRDGIGFGDPDKRRTVEQSGGDAPLKFGVFLAISALLLGLVLETTWVRAMVLGVGGVSVVVAMASLRSLRPRFKRWVAMSVILACLAAVVASYFVEIY